MIILYKRVLIMKKIIAFLMLFLSVCIMANSAEVPLDAKLDYNQGIDFYKLGMYERAVESFRSAIRTYPDYLDAYYNLGTVLDYLKNYSEALSIRRQLASSNPEAYLPDVAMSLYNLANLQYNLHQYEEAEKNYAEALAILESLEAKEPGTYTVKIEDLKSEIAELKAQKL